MLIGQSELQIFFSSNLFICLRTCIQYLSINTLT